MSSSVETNGGDVEKAIGKPEVANEKPQDTTTVVVDAGHNMKKKVRFVKFAKFTNRRVFFSITNTLFFMLALVAIIIMALQIGRDQDTIQKLGHEADGKDTTSQGVRAIGGVLYMDGFNGMIEEDDVALVDRAVMATSVSSTVTSIVDATSTTDICDDETDAPESTLMPVANVTSAIAVVTTASVVTTTTVQAFLSNTHSSVSTVTSVSALDGSRASMTTVASFTTTTQTCGEWGDGAGPCDRPYGAPNTQPGSAISTLPPVMTIPTSKSLPMTNASSSLRANMSMTATPSTTFTAQAVSALGSLSSITTVAKNNSTRLSGTCFPATTATIYITVAASNPTTVATSVSPQTANGSSVSRTTTTTTSLVTTLTKTITGSNGPVVTTETLTGAANHTSAALTPSWTNTTTTTLASTTTHPTYTLPSVTLTFTSAHGGGDNTSSASTFTSTSTATGSGGGHSPTAAATFTNSGGEKAIGKPLGANGNGGGTGNGLYCVVMLVSLAALVI